MGRARTPFYTYQGNSILKHSVVVNWEATEANADLEKVGTRLAFPVLIHA